MLKMVSGYEISGFALGLAAMFEISNEVRDMYVTMNRVGEWESCIALDGTNECEKCERKSKVANRCARKKEKW